MNRHQLPVDRRPFRSKADQEREKILEAQYRRLAIPEVVAAAQLCAGRRSSATNNDE